MYSARVMDHFTNPRNVGIIEDANVVVRVGLPAEKMHCSNLAAGALHAAVRHIRAQLAGDNPAEG